MSYYRGQGCGYWRGRGTRHNFYIQGQESVIRIPLIPPSSRSAVRRYTVNTGYCKSVYSSTYNQLHPRSNHSPDQLVFHFIFLIMYRNGLQCQTQVLFFLIVSCNLISETKGNVSSFFHTFNSFRTIRHVSIYLCHQKLIK